MIKQFMYDTIFDLAGERDVPAIHPIISTSKKGESMPLLEITTSRKVTATVSLEEPTANLVNQYAAFTRVAADDVVNKAFEYVFTKDKDFQKFIGAPNDAKPIHSLRIKRSGDDAPKGKPGTQACNVSTSSDGSSHRERNGEVKSIAPSIVCAGMEAVLRTG